MRYVKIIQKEMGYGMTKLSIREGKSGDGEVLLEVTANEARFFAVRRAEEWLMGWLRWDGYKPVYGGDDTIRHWQRDDRPAQVAAA